MDNRIILTGVDKTALNILIDEKLKEDYLLSGGMFHDDDNVLSQVMTIPHNIDPEITMAGGVKLVIFGIIYAFLFYFLT